jgi:hypothetical protein
MSVATEVGSERSTPQDREFDLPPDKPVLRELLVAAEENLAAAISNVRRASALRVELDDALARVRAVRHGYCGASRMTADEEWEGLEERLGSPQDVTATRRAQELKANGWQMVSVVFETWRFRRPKQRSTMRSGTATNEATSSHASF